MCIISLIDINLSNLSNWISTLASIISVMVAIYIFSQWKKQKRHEVIANDANILLNEVIKLREEILRSKAYGSIDKNFISYIADKRDSIESILKIITFEKNYLEYKSYINSITYLIRKWQQQPQPDYFDDLIHFGKETNELIEKLTKIKLYKF
ncbi:hypothetical protein OHV80_18725 [Acinetobacter baumannii]|nr:hypothetical protein [Acinetobacter baumannii]